MCQIITLEVLDLPTHHLWLQFDANCEKIQYVSDP